MSRLVLLILFVLYSPASAFFTAEGDIAALQDQTKMLTPGERIAFWAEQFVGTPYDTDPLGEYVRRNVIVSDERVDCMYLTFRAVELAFGKNPDDSLKIALDMRFIHRGKVEGRNVVNYEDRFQYAESMIESGKWGKDITQTLSGTSVVSGPPDKKIVIIAASDAFAVVGALQNGDIVFFVNAPEKTVNGTAIGHMGIIKTEADTAYLIHASGRKETGGSVKKVLLKDYLSKMPFAGIKVSRFPADVRMSE